MRKKLLFIPALFAATVMQANGIIDVSKVYRIKNVETSYVLTQLATPAKETEPCSIKTSAESDDYQLWQFEPVDESKDIYYLRNYETGQYVSTSQTQNYVVTMADHCIFAKVQLVKGNTYDGYLINFQASIEPTKGTGLGTDNNREGSACYSDKYENSKNSRWNTWEFVETEAQTKKLPTKYVPKSYNGTYAIAIDNGKFFTVKEENTKYAQRQTGTFYTAFLDEGAAKAYSAGGGSKVLDWAFNIIPINNNDASEGVRFACESKNGADNKAYLHKTGYVTNDETESKDNLFYILGNDSTDKVTIMRADGKFLKNTSGWNTAESYNFINTDTDPRFVFRLTQDTLLWKKYDATTTTDYSPKSQYTVFAKLKRSLDNEQWSTIVLPYPVKDLARTFGENAVAAQLESYNNNTLNFRTVNSLEANKPYLIKVGTTADEYITESVKEAESNSLTDTQAGASFIGTYTNGKVPTGAYFVNDNKLYEAADETNTLKPFRGYINVSETNAAKELALNINGTPTSITSIDHGGKVDIVKGIYTLSGQLVKTDTTNLSSLAKGAYIINGKKVIIK